MPSSKEKTEMAIVAVEMILKHGVPVFMSTIRTLKTDNPTIEEIRALRDQVKDPASYFDKEDA
jgi:hypothetical protein